MNNSKTILLKLEQAAEYNQIHQDSSQELSSTGQDPHWIWQHQKIQPGWHKITASIKLASLYPSPTKCYFSNNDQFSESLSCILQQQDENKYIGYFYTKQEIQTFRLDPMETSGKITFSHLEIEQCDAVDVPDDHKPAHFSPTLVDKLKATHAFPTLNKIISRFPRIKRAIHQVLVSKSDTNPKKHYHDWLVANENIPSITFQKNTTNKLTFKPVISIIIPTYNTDSRLLKECIESVLNQGYPHWELCIADDASSNIKTKNLLKQYRDSDSRIKVVFRKENGHICKASNDALSLASGDWVGLLDHDDLLAPHALLIMAKAINKHPKGKVFYSDEDKIDINGVRSDPHLKPSWSRDLLYSHNYISHFGIYKKNLVDTIGGFRVGLEGSQDYDLILRSMVAIEDDNLPLMQSIIHVPHILYHWRALEGSTAMGEDQKGYTELAGKKALENILASVPKATVTDGALANTYKVNWPIPSQEPLVSLIIPTKNGLNLVKQCIESIENKTQYKNYEIILVDNQSDQQEDLNYFQELHDSNRVTLLRYEKPFNYSAINNYAINYAQGEVIVLLNNDVEVINQTWLTELVSQALRSEIGCVGAKLYYPDDTLQHAGVILGLGGVAGHSHKYFPKDHSGYFKRLKITQNLSAVTAACLAVRKEVYLEVNGLNETDLTVAFNDVDFCLKVQSAGYSNLWTPYAELYHHESVSRGVEDTPEKIARFAEEIDYMKKNWSSQLQQDPFYHLALTRDREDFSLR